MKARGFWMALALAALATVMTARAQEPSLDWRLEHVAGVAPAEAREFFATLRRGLGNGDKAAVCGLVAYPLHQPAGTIDSAARCEARYDDIFTVAVRRAVGRAQPDELFAAPTGVAFGFGELWFARCQGSQCPQGGLHITQVNGADDGSLQPPGGKLLLGCALAGAGEGRWLTLTADGHGGAEFRMWSPEAGLYASSPPTLVMMSLPGRRDTAPRCAFRTHAFADAAASYTIVSEPACADLADRIPPMGTVGVVTRVTGGGEPETLWCIQ